jgi:hypothetical protein
MLSLTEALVGCFEAESLLVLDLAKFHPAFQPCDAKQLGIQSNYAKCDLGPLRENWSTRWIGFLACEA